MSAHLQKVCSVSIAGFGTLPLADSGNTFKASGKKRDHVAGSKPSHGGFTEAHTPAELSLSLTAKKTLDTQAIGLMENEIITIKTTNGVTHVMSNAWSEEQPELGDDGKFKVKFISNESEKLS